MVEYASVLMNKYLVGKDGKTAFERLRGKKSKMLGFEFGESVHFRRIPLQSRTQKARQPLADGTLRRISDAKWTNTWWPTERELSRR